MDRCAFFHQYESNYAFPISKNELKVRVRTKRGDSITKIECLWNVSYLYFKERKSTTLTYRCSTSLFDYYEAVLYSAIPEFAYIFKIECDEGTLFYSEDGFSDSENISESEISTFRLAFINEIDLISFNKRFNGGVVYQIFPERFNQGDFDKDTSYINTEWGIENLKHHSNRSFQIFLGGDLLGVEKKLDYLKELGVKTIYLTPIHPSFSNHKYDIVDYFGVDEMFGGEKAFASLVDKIHKNNMNIVMDMVFNHTSFLHPFFLDVKQKGKNSPYYDFYMINGDEVNVYPPNYFAFHGGAYMPKLNTSNLKVQQYLIEVGKYYLNKYHIDGYRLDVANEVSHDFWISFKKELRKIDKDFILIGEVWHNSYSYLHSYEFDSVMNYPFLTACINYFVNDKLNTTQFVEKLNELLMRYTDNSNKMMLNLLDSHDMPRFYSLLNKDKDKYLTAFLLLIMYQGYPMIYYGDEIFMEGEKDPDNRRGMKWDSELFSSKEHQIFKDILHLRKNDILNEGDIKIYEKKSLLIIERIFKSKKILSIINNSKSEIIFDFDLNMKNFKQLLSHRYLNFTFAPHSFLVVECDE